MVTEAFNFYSTPKRVEVREVGETIEMIYLETSTLQLAVIPPPPPVRRVFKIVYSCVDGKWNKSDKIYGEIKPPSDEQYQF